MYRITTYNDELEVRAITYADTLEDAMAEYTAIICELAFKARHGWSVDVIECDIDGDLVCYIGEHQYY